MMIDIEELLRAISDAAPAGEDVVFSPLYDQLQEARHEEDAGLEQGEWVRNVKEADWPKALKLSAVLLSGHSKDLRVAGYWLEAQTKVEGFVGLEAGLLLLGELCDRYWETLYPQLEEGDWQVREGNLVWIISRATELARSVPLTHGNGDTDFGFAVWEAANQLAHDIKRVPAEAHLLAQGRVTLEAFNSAKNNTAATFFQSTWEAVIQCRAAVGKFDEVLVRKVGEERPSLSGLLKVLAEIEEILVRFASEAGLVLARGEASRKKQAEKLQERIEPTLGSHPEAMPGKSLVNMSQIVSRQQALAQLKEIARFFRETEPHSPVGYLAEKAAVWGEMPLHEWLSNVIKNPEALAGLQEQLGLPKAAS